LSEPAAAQLIGRLAGAVLAIERPHPVRVAIDGRSAAGKTTFAEALAAALRLSGRRVLRASIDDFHPPGHAARSAAGGYSAETVYEEGFDYAAFKRLVLEPLGAGGDRRVTLALHDSLADRPIAGAAAVAHPDAIVIVDGAFLLRVELRGCWDLAIWLDVSFETMLARAVRRDVAWVGDEAKVRDAYLRRWAPAHRLYEATGAMAAAHVVIDNEDPFNPRLIRSGLAGF
jgi:uridine kinase